MRGVLKLLCFVGILSFAFPAIGNQTVYEYMTSDQFGDSNYSKVSLIEGTRLFQSPEDVDDYDENILNVEVDYAVFAPNYWHSEAVTINSYLQGSELLSDDDYLYVYRIRNLGDTDPSSGLNPTVVSSLNLHQYHQIGYKVGSGSPSDADKAPAQITLGASEDTDSHLVFNFDDYSDTSYIFPGQNSTLLLIASSYNYDWYPSTIQGGNGLSDQQDLPVPVPVPIPGALLLGALGVGCVSYLRKGRSL